MRATPWSRPWRPLTESEACWLLGGLGGGGGGWGASAGGQPRRNPPLCGVAGPRTVVFDACARHRVGSHLHTQPASHQPGAQQRLPPWVPAARGPFSPFRAAFTCRQRQTLALPWGRRLAARRQLKALEAQAGVPVLPEPVANDASRSGGGSGSSGRSALWSLPPAPTSRPAVVICHSLPTNWASDPATNGPSDQCPPDSLKHGIVYTIGRTMFETDRWDCRCLRARAGAGAGVSTRAVPGSRKRAVRHVGSLCTLAGGRQRHVPRRQACTACEGIAMQIYTTGDGMQARRGIGQPPRP